MLWEILGLSLGILLCWALFRLERENPFVAIWIFVPTIFMLLLLVDITGGIHLSMKEEYTNITKVLAIYVPAGVVIGVLKAMKRRG